jgi:hypothetical protein
MAPEDPRIMRRWRAMRRSVVLGMLCVSAAVIACGRGPEGAVAPSAPSPVPPPPSSPPTPLPTDWKGLFDSDSQSSNTLPPTPESAADVLRKEPECSRAIAVATGGFTTTSRDERAYLLACGATERVVIADEQAIVASLDVSEDTLIDAGDLDLDGPHELLLVGHAGTKSELRALRADHGRLLPVYVFTAAPDACSHVIVYYRLVKPHLEFRVDTLPKRCTP